MRNATLELHCEVAGYGPLLVLLHGLGSTGLGWALQVLSLDLRGGHGGRRSRRMPVELMPEEVAGLLKRLAKLRSIGRLLLGRGQMEYAEVVAVGAWQLAQHKGDDRALMNRVVISCVRGELTRAGTLLEHALASPDGAFFVGQNTRHVLGCMPGSSCSAYHSLPVSFRQVMLQSLAWTFQVLT